jgi:hypothetical protein
MQSTLLMLTRSIVLRFLFILLEEDTKVQGDGIVREKESNVCKINHSLESSLKLNNTGEKSLSISNFTFLYRSVHSNLIIHITRKSFDGIFHSRCIIIVNDLSLVIVCLFTWSSQYFSVYLSRIVFNLFFVFFYRDAWTWQLSPTLFVAFGWQT